MRNETTNGRREMTKQEINQAVKLLEDNIDRYDTIIDGAGQSLTVYWLDGSGQRLFVAIDEVRDHVATH
jgi:hypothetical protein